jgi:trimeric autotransporter adhesin
MEMSFTPLAVAALLALFQQAPQPPALPQTAPAPVQGSAAASACTINGTLTSGKVPLPGVVLTLTNNATPDAQPVDVTASNPDGSYALKVPGPGQYTLKGQLTAFAPIAQPITLDASNCSSRVDLQMVLASRAPAPAPVAAPKPAETAPANTANGAPANGAAANGANAQNRARGANRGAQQGPRQFQSLSLVADQAGLAQGGSDGERETMAQAQALLPPGFSPESSSESVTAFGTQSRGTESLFGPGGPGERFGPGGLPEGLDAAGAATMLGFGPPGIGFAGAGGGGPFGGGPGGGGFGPGGGGGFGGGFGGGPGGGGFGGGPFGGGVGRGPNQIRGSFFQSFDTSNFDSAPYALNGQATSKPSYLQQRFGATIGGPLTIPKLLPSDTRTFFFLNYTGNHSRNPYDQYSTVPTAAQRAGDLSAFGTPIIDPSTGQPFAGNVIPGNRLNAASQSLLNLFPLPNQDGSVKNFHNVTTTTTQMDDINVRFIRNFGATPQRRPGQNGRAAGGGAGGGGRGGGGGFGGGRGGPGGGGQNLNITVHYRHADSTNVNPFPALGGDTKTSGWDVSGGYSASIHGIVNQLRVSFNRQNSHGQNLYAFNQDIASNAGLQGVSTDPFDWGAPSLSFSRFSSLRDMSPSQRTDQTIAISESMLKIKGKHSLRWGGDYRDIRFDSRTDANARGSYVFTGLFTGSDFADYLLGLPQQSTVQFGPGTERFRSTSWDLFFQDDWRIAPKLTINAGIRYEYFSPVSEADNRLVTLAAPSDFSAAAPVVAGGASPFGGTLPDTIVNPFRTGVAPRVGIAWRAPKSFIVRSGYGINYNSRSYSGIATQLAGQPPFATTGTVLSTIASPVLLQNALASVSPDATNNTYGIDPNYRLGFVQIWNLDVQRDLTRTLNVDLGYVGTKGANLDVLRAPNRGPDGLRIAGVPPFIWESSGADSIMHMFTVRLRKRMTKGVAMGGSYTLSKSIDEASSIGGSGGVVAQNDLDLAAERGLSSFDQRHRVSGDFSYELPFGENRHWLNQGGTMAALLGNWTFNGNVQFASGTPFTARVLASVSDVARGTNGTLRANYNGEPIAVSDPSTLQFFNTAAFSIPVAGTFGDAGRNTIIGPGTSVMNLGLTRQIPLGQSRGLSVTLLANNVLNTVQWSTIDTVVNSPTFGQVLSVRPMRTFLVTTRFRF